MSCRCLNDIDGEDNAGCADPHSGTGDQLPGLAGRATAASRIVSELAAVAAPATRVQGDIAVESRLIDAMSTSRSLRIRRARDPGSSARTPNRCSVPTTSPLLLSRALVRAICTAASRANWPRRTEPPSQRATGFVLQAGHASSILVCQRREPGHSESEYARQWAATRPHRPTTAVRVASLIDKHIDGSKIGARALCRTE